MSTMSIIGFGRNTKVFAVKESVIGSLEIPANGNLIIVNSAELQVPMPSMEEDKGLRNSRSMFNRYPVGVTPAAPFKISHYLRPSGAAGTAPESSDVIESTYGKKTVSGGVSVAYAPESTQPAFSLYVKKDHTVFAATGCVAAKRSIKKDNKSLLVADVDGAAMSVIWTGTGTMGEAITTAPAPGTEEWWAVDDVKKFCTGSHVIVDSEQMQVTGTYWEGTAGGSAGKIKLKRGYNGSTPATHLISVAIAPWLPAGTELGAPIAARAGALTIDGVSLPFLDCSYEYDSGAKHIEEEWNGTDKSADYLEGDIKVAGKTSIYFRKDKLLWFADAVKQTRKAAVINFGTVAGKKIALTLASVEFDMPTYTGDRDAIKLDVPWRAYAVAGQDEAEEKYL